MKSLECSERRSQQISQHKLSKSVRKHKKPKLPGQIPPNKAHKKQSSKNEVELSYYQNSNKITTETSPKKRLVAKKGRRVFNWLIVPIRYYQTILYYIWRRPTWALRTSISTSKCSGSNTKTATRPSASRRRLWAGWTNTWKSMMGGLSMSNNWKGASSWYFTSWLGKRPTLKAGKGISGIICFETITCFRTLLNWDPPTDHNLIWIY